MFTSSQKSYVCEVTAKIRGFASLSRRTFTRAIGLAGLSTTLAFSLRAWAASWESIKKSKGIQVFRKEIPNSPLQAFRGTMTVKAPLEKLLWILADNQHRKEWVDRLVKSVVLEKTSDYDTILYQHFKLPPLMADRDFVYRARAETQSNGDIIVRINSVDHPKAPPTVGVRALIIESTYLLRRQEGDSTYVDLKVIADPKGSLPNWLINYIQKSWPHKTLASLRQHVKKTYIERLNPPPAS